MSGSGMPDNRGWHLYPRAGFTWTLAWGVGRLSGLWAGIVLLTSAFGQLLPVKGCIGCLSCMEQYICDPVKIM